MIKREPALLSRMCYRKVLKVVEHYRKQDEDDRRETPNRIPTSWGIPLRHSIEQTIREVDKTCPRGLPDQVLDMLYRQGHLIKIFGDYGFSRD